MNLERQRQILDLSLELMSMSEDVRQKRLNALLEEDTILYKDVMVLLSQSEGSDIGQMMAETAAPFLDMTLEIGQRMGPYTLESIVGEGGMGRVYLAQQEQPIKRTVALKVIKGAQFGPDARKRFEMERNTLALMDHPAIAVAYEAGASDDGQPYIAMEYVDGLPIDAYCDKHQLTIEDRIKLFLKVAEGIQHAHQRGIIHRDIKPSNILIKEMEDGPQPKIIDFGLAKAFEGELANNKTLTNAHGIMGSLEYMSPEQLLGEPIDIRTDVFALTMVLHKILVGTLPQSSKTKENAHPIFSRIAQLRKGFSRPSASFMNHDEEDVEKAVAKRRTTRQKLLKQLKNDLDWVILKGLEENRDNRFPAVGDLIGDLGRFIRNEPLLVRPPSLLYKARKFAIRHKAATLAGLVSVSAVVIGIFLALSGLVEARAAQKVAKLESTKALAINEFLQEMLWSPNPYQGNKDIKVRDVLVDAATKLEGSFENQPEVRVALATTIGKTFHQIGEHDRAIELLRKVIDGGKQHLSADNLDLIKAEIELAETLVFLGKHQEAIELNQHVVAKMEASDHTKEVLYTQALNNLGIALFYTGQKEEGVRYLTRCLEARKEILGVEHPRTLGSQGNLVVMMAWTNKKDQALVLSRELFAVKKRAIGPKDPSTLHSMESLGQFEAEAGNHRIASELLRKHLHLCREVFGEEHLRTIHAANIYSEALLDEGRYLEAEPIARKYSAYFQKYPNYKGPLSTKARTLGVIGRSQLERGEFIEAESTFREMLALTEENKGNVWLEGVVGLAQTLAALNNFAGARELLANTLISELAETKDPEREASLHEHLGKAFIDWDLKSAEQHMAQALSGASEKYQTRKLKTLLAEVFLKAKKYNQALPLFEALRKEPSFQDANVEMNYGRCLTALGQEGMPHLEKAIELARQTRMDHDVYLAHILLANAMAQKESGQNANANQLMEQALKIYEQTLGPESTQVRDLKQHLSP